MRLRERLEIRAPGIATAHPGEQWALERMADRHGEDGIGLAAGWLPTRQLDVRILADLLAAGVTAERFAWLR
jgi:hypothetical protein